MIMADKKKTAKPAKVKSGKYPHKKSLNLVVKEKSSVNYFILIPVLALLVFGGLVFSKFMILDRFTQVEQAKSEVAILQSNHDMLVAYTAKYPEVEEEYQRYSTKWMTNEESGTVSRMDMLKLIEKEFMEEYAVMNISSTGNVISLKVAGIDLDTMSEMVKTLYARDDVAKVEVSSANNTEIVLKRRTAEDAAEDAPQNMKEALRAAAEQFAEAIGKDGEDEFEEVEVDVVTVIITMQQPEGEEQK